MLWIHQCRAAVRANPRLPMASAPAPGHLIQHRGLHPACHQCCHCLCPHRAPQALSWTVKTSWHATGSAVVSLPQQGSSKWSSSVTCSAAGSATSSQGSEEPWLLRGDSRTATAGRECCPSWAFPLLSPVVVASRESLLASRELPDPWGLKGTASVKGCRVQQTLRSKPLKYKELQEEHE